MSKIDQYSPRSGRLITENDTVINEADVLSEINESLNETLVVIPVEHERIHQGMAFITPIITASIATSGVKRYRLRTPVGKHLHIKELGIHASGSGLKIEIIKEPTIVNAGTEVVGIVQNLNDNVLTTPETKVFADTTFTGGVVWDTINVSGDTSEAAAKQIIMTGVHNQNIEYITKKDSDYVLVITNLSTTDVAININVRLFFYEYDHSDV